MLSPQHNQKGPKSKLNTATPLIEKPAKKLSKKRKVKSKSEVPTECNCNDLFDGQPNGIVYWDGDNLTILSFPSASSTLQYINGSPVWVNNN